MILLFLGSWRSTIIIIISIPLSILFSVICISWLRETINVMTLGGLALAVGMLVDEGTVTLENIYFHLEQGKEVEPAILDGAQQIVIPAFVTLLVLDIVFAPMFELGGVAGYLFRPLAEAVVFALIASFLLSRTLVPTMARYLLQAQTRSRGAHGPPPARRAIRSSGFSEGFEHTFTLARDRYRALLLLALGRPKTFIAGFLTVWRCRSASRHSSVRISFRRWIPGRFSCTFARSRAPASRRRRACSISSSRPCARRFRPTNSTTSSTNRPAL